MKVIYTDQSLFSLESALNFLLEELEFPLEKVLTIKDAVLNRVDGLTKHPHS